MLILSPTLSRYGWYRNPIGDAGKSFKGTFEGDEKVQENQSTIIIMNIQYAPSSTTLRNKNRSL